MSKQRLSQTWHVLTTSLIGVLFGRIMHAWHPIDLPETAMGAFLLLALWFGGTGIYMAGKKAR